MQFKVTVPQYIPAVLLVWFWTMHHTKKISSISWCGKSARLIELLHIWHISLNMILFVKKKKPPTMLWSSILSLLHLFSKITRWSTGHKMHSNVFHMHSLKIIVSRTIYTIYLHEFKDNYRVVQWHCIIYYN